jgi:hypothetical protein
MLESEARMLNKLVRPTHNAVEDQLNNQINSHYLLHCISIQHITGTWNVRSLHQGGKEMSRMNIDVMDVAETFWDRIGNFHTVLPTTNEEYRLIYS